MLESVVKFRWKLLPAEQREGIRTYLVQKIIAVAQDERALRAEASLVSKLNLTLVQVLKHEWPHNWPTFISDIVGSSRTSEVLCENNVAILRLLSEEVFDFSKESMTAAKAEALRQSLSAEFRQVFELCGSRRQGVPAMAARIAYSALPRCRYHCSQLHPPGVNSAVAREQDAPGAAALRHVDTRPGEAGRGGSGAGGRACTKHALQSDSCHMRAPPPRPPAPAQYLFETRLLETLCVKFFPVAAFRTDTLMVLAEVGGLVRPAYNRMFEQLYIGVLSQLVRFLPPDTTLRKVWRDLPTTEQTFVRHLALFLTAFFTAHGELLEVEAYRPALLSGLNYLVAISDLDDTEIFKICLEYWLFLSNELYTLDCSYAPTRSGPAGLIGDRDPSTGRPLTAAPMHPRKAVYAEVLSRVREVM